MYFIDFNAKRIKYKIDKYKINNNNACTKHEFKVKYERYQQRHTSDAFFLNDGKKQHIFAETCLYETVGSLPVMSSLLPHVL